MEEEKNYWDKVPLWVYKKLQGLPLEDIEDIGQDILYHIWKSRKKFKGNSSFDTWATTIAKRRVVQFFRDREAKDKLDGKYALVMAKTDGVVTKSDPLSYLIAEQILSRLSSTNRIIVSSRLDDEPFNEIAESLDLTYEAARSRYRRAIARLRNELS